MDFSKWQPEILIEIQCESFLGEKYSGPISFRYYYIFVYFCRLLLSKWITEKTWEMLVMKQIMTLLAS
jgi:hypothetical protein